MNISESWYTNLCCSFLMASFLLCSSVSALAQEEVTRQEAIEIVQQEFAGKVLDVKKKGGFYKVKLLTKGGRVKQIRVDALSGKVLRRKKL